jgi:hypothetical protein
MLSNPMPNGSWPPPPGGRPVCVRPLLARRGCTLRSLVGTLDMKLTNDSYVILIGKNNFTERYYRDQTDWVKVSAGGRKFRMTAEQVLNHLLPAIAGLKPNLTVRVEHHG